MQMKKPICAILAAVMLLAVISTAGTPIAAAASKGVGYFSTNPGFSLTTSGMQFTDVPESEWYYNDVKIAYQSGLIDGRSQTTFAPADNLTYSEAVKLAACMHQLSVNGAVTLTNASPVWYQSYVDYAKANNIISKDYDWNAQATRAGYIEIFANALPAGSLNPINEIPDGAIPDVSMAHPQAGAIYTLYRAGILQGVDPAHNCDPSSNIRRREVAAILTRMMFEAERIRFTIGGISHITLQEARSALQAWVDNHPFQMGGELEPESDNYVLDGVEYYRFYIGIIRLGVAEILVNQETGEIYHFNSPYSTGGFQPIDNWYNQDHAAGAAAVSGAGARELYNSWIERYTEMSEYALSGDQYVIYYEDGWYYYQFRAENEEFYWFNILVNMDTGELFVMIITDGEETVAEIWPIIEWYAAHFAVG